MNNLSNERFEEGAKLSRDALERTCHFQKATAPKSEGDCTANRREFWGWEAKRGDTKELFTTHFSRSLLAPDRLLCSGCRRKITRDQSTVLAILLPSRLHSPSGASSRHRPSSATYTGLISFNSADSSKGLGRILRIGHFYRAAPSLLNEID